MEVSRGETASSLRCTGGSDGTCGARLWHTTRRRRRQEKKFLVCLEPPYILDFGRASVRNKRIGEKTKMKLRARRKANRGACWMKVLASLAGRFPPFSSLRGFFFRFVFAGREFAAGRRCAFDFCELRFAALCASRSLGGPDVADFIMHRGDVCGAWALFGLRRHPCSQTGLAILFGRSASVGRPGR